jgi:hypothetical protein
MMKQMIERVPEPYGSAEASKVARDLDSKIESLLTAACR